MFPIFKPLSLAKRQDCDARFFPISIVKTLLSTRKQVECLSREPNPENLSQRQGLGTTRAECRHSPWSSLSVEFYFLYRIILTEPGNMTGCAAAAAAKSLQSCPTLCDPMDDSPPGSAVPGILQRTLEWVAISFSNA